MRRIVFLLLAGGVALSTSPAWGDSFTLSPGSVTLPAVPAGPGDILHDVPVSPAMGIPFPALGLFPGDVVDAISDGLDPVFLPGHLDYFSVTPGSTGAPGSGVFGQFLADTPPGATPGHASDIFLANGGVPPGTNILAPPGFGWTLGSTSGDEANAGLLNPGPPPGDNVNSYDLATILMGAPVYFSLAAGSPSLPGLGAGPGDVLAVGGPYGPVPIVFIPAAVLGLPFGADLDALALFTGGGGPFAGPGSIEYSLTAATAPFVGVSGADILGLGFGPPVMVVHPAGAIGLLPTDDLDALDVSQLQVPEPASLSMILAGMAILAVRRKH